MKSNSQNILNNFALVLFFFSERSNGSDVDVVMVQRGGGPRGVGNHGHWGWGGGGLMWSHGGGGNECGGARGDGGGQERRSHGQAKRDRGAVGRRRTRREIRGGLDNRFCVIFLRNYFVQNFYCNIVKEVVI